MANGPAPRSSRSASAAAGSGDLAAFPRPSIAVDVALLTVLVHPDGTPFELSVLLVRRADEPHAGEWGLPGSMLRERERLADATRRTLWDKCHVDTEAPFQLPVFDDPFRDDRGWVLSIAHTGTAPEERLREAVDSERWGGSVALAPLRQEWTARSASDGMRDVLQTVERFKDLSSTGEVFRTPAILDLRVLERSGRSGRGADQRLPTLSPTLGLADAVRGRGPSMVSLPDGQRRLPFDHDAIVALALEHLRSRYREVPDPDRLLGEPFTLLQLRQLHELILGEPLKAKRDTFRRQMEPMLVGTGRTKPGVPGKPAELYVHA